MAFRLFVLVKALRACTTDYGDHDAGYRRRSGKKRRRRGRRRRRIMV
jgi:hypothetical protein